jgi:hypothetical protein
VLQNNFEIPVHREIFVWFFTATARFFISQKLKNIIPSQRLHRRLAKHQITTLLRGKKNRTVFQASVIADSELEINKIL